MKRTVEVKYGIALHTKQMIKVNELTTRGKTSNLAKHLSLAHPDLFRELTLEIDRLVGLGTETRYKHGTGTYGTGMYRTESERRFRCHT